MNHPNTPDSVRVRLQALRDWLDKTGTDAFVVPSTDPHLSEYVAPPLAIARVALGLHRLGRDLGRDAARRRTVDRLALLSAGRTTVAGQWHQALP